MGPELAPERAVQMTPSAMLPFGKGPYRHE